MKNGMGFITLIVATYLAFSLPAFACTCEPEDDSETDTILLGKSEKGAKVVVRIPNKPVTMSSKKAFVCSSDLERLTKLELWMPEHGHGSGPTQIVESDTSCSMVERIKFLMKGTWELQLQFENDDRAKLNVVVK